MRETRRSVILKHKDTSVPRADAAGIARGIRFPMTDD